MSKLIKAVFTGRFCRTQRVFQFDTDDKLQFVNVDLPANFTVDFSNSKTGDSVSVLATSDTVQIPPDLFVPGSEIYAWIWLSDSNGGHTRCEATIPIDPRARRTSTEPTPAQASAWDEAVDTLNETVEGIPAVVNAALTEAKESGEFDGEDGADGSNAWMIDVQYTDTVNTTIRAKTEHLIGPPNARPMYGDVLFVSDGRFGNIFSPGTRITMATLLGDLHGEPGEDGYSPVVTITEIDGGHRVTITDEDHPQGQSFDVLDGQGGSGSSDYNDLSNKPQIAGVTLSGDKSLADLGIAAASDIPTVPSAYTSTPADLGTASAGSSTSWAKGDHVHKMPSAADVGAYALPSGGIPASDLASAVQDSLGKADTALQSAPVTSVNGQTGAVTVTEPFFVTYSTSDMTTWNCNKTFAQIVAAMAAGKQVVLLASVAGTPIIQACSFVVLPSGIQAWVRIGQASRYSIQHLSDNSVIITEFTENAQWLGAVPENQGVSHAGEFLVVGSNGDVTTMSLSTWSAGSY